MSQSCSTDATTRHTLGNAVLWESYKRDKRLWPVRLRILRSSKVLCNCNTGFYCSSTGSWTLFRPPKNYSFGGLGWTQRNVFTMGVIQHHTATKLPTLFIQPPCSVVFMTGTKLFLSWPGTGNSLDRSGRLGWLSSTCTCQATFLWLYSSIQRLEKAFFFLQFASLRAHQPYTALHHLHAPQILSQSAMSNPVSVQTAISRSRSVPTHLALHNVRPDKSLFWWPVFQNQW